MAQERLPDGVDLSGSRALPPAPTGDVGGVVHFRCRNQHPDVKPATLPGGGGAQVCASLRSPPQETWKLPGRSIRR